MSKAQKEALRLRFGYCTTCSGVPSLLFDIHKSRLNPLWTTKKPRTVGGESDNGKCLRCLAEAKSSGRPVVTNSSHSNGSRASSLTTPDSVHSIGSRSNDGSSHAIGSGSGHGSRDTNRLTQQGAIPARSLRNSSDHASPTEPVQLQRIQRPIRNDSTRSSTSIGRSRHSPSRGHSSRVESESSSSSRTTTLASQSEHGVRRATPPSRSIPSRSLSGQARTVPMAAVKILAPQAQDSASYGSDTGNTIIEEVSTESTLDGAPSEVDVDKAIADLQPLIKDLLEAGRDSSDILLDILGSSMDSFPSVERYQEFCLGAISRSLGSSEICGASLASSNLHEHVLSSMKRFPSAEMIQEHCCTVIFAVAANPNNRVVLVRGNICSYLIDAMTAFAKNTKLVTCAIGALRNLSLEPEAHGSLKKLPAREISVFAMQSNLEDSVVQRDGCALLSNLAVDAENKTVATVSLEVIEAVVSAIDAHQGDASVVASACFALKNFTFQESNLRSLRRIKNVLEVLCSTGELADSSEEIEFIVDRIHTSRAEDESLEEQAHESLLAMVELQSDRPSELVATVMTVLKEYEWSNQMTLVCLGILGNHRVELDGTDENVLKATGVIEQLNIIVESYGVDTAVEKEARQLLACMGGNEGECS